MELAYLPMDIMNLIARHTSPHVVIGRSCVGLCCWRESESDIVITCGCSKTKCTSYISDFLRLTAVCKEMFEISREIVHPTILLWNKYHFDGAVDDAIKRSCDYIIERLVVTQDGNEQFTYLKECVRQSVMTLVKNRRDKNNELRRAWFPPSIISAFEVERIMSLLK